MTTYTNIIGTAPFFKNIPADDQGYLQGALQEEMSHYLLEESLTRKPDGVHARSTTRRRCSPTRRRR